MKLLKPAHVKNMTLMSCGVFILLLTFHQARSAAGGVLIVPPSPKYRSPAFSFGHTSHRPRSNWNELGRGTHGHGFAWNGFHGNGICWHGQHGHACNGQWYRPTTSSSEGEKKVVGKVNPLTGTIVLEADKLKDSLGQVAAEEPPAPPEEDPAE
ncbi:hypothetical protein MRX96_045689 [Rhipicephalus microplus]